MANMQSGKDFGARVNMDTRRPRASMRLDFALAAASSLAAAVFCSSAAAAPVSLPEAKVIWQRAGHVYVVLGDPAEIALRDTLLIESGKKRIAAAAVVGLAEGGLAVGRIVTGTLERERRLERLRVRLERESLPSPSTIRLGVPSNRRAAERFGCGPWTLRSPAAVFYNIEPTGRLSFRMIRERSRDAAIAPGAAPAAAWPDSIVVSLFDDAAEEEIALERGDLDVALFGPGELSERLRNDPRWQGRLFADRSGPASADSAATGTAGASSARGVPFPVLAPANLVPYVRALGPSEFLGMLDCGGARRPETP